MSFPTIVQALKFEESGLSTIHNFPKFDAVEAHDVIYWIACLSTMTTPNVSNGGGWAYYQYKNPQAQGKNQALTLVKGLFYDCDGSEDQNAISITTGATRLGAGVAVQVRGCGTQPAWATDENYPVGDPNNPKMTGIVDTSHTGKRIPHKTQAQGPDSLAIAAFARVGQTAYQTVTAKDSIGAPAGLSAGAPYLEYRSKDYFPFVDPRNGGADNTNTRPFTNLLHAESVDPGGWKVQVGMSYIEAAAADWGGHEYGPNGAPDIPVGTIRPSWWECNGPGGSFPNVPTAFAGIRLKGA